MILTDKQKRVLEILRAYIDHNGQSPTITELRDMLELKNINSVIQFLDSLEHKGFIARGNGFRSIRITGIIGQQLTFDIPVLGFANAGKPLAYSDEEKIGNIPVSKSILKNDAKHYFFVKVSGTSMNAFRVNGKILQDKSYALVNTRDRTPNEQDAFLCLVNECATLKKIRKEKDCVYLIPVSEDSVHQPIIISQNDPLIINGKVEDVFNVDAA